MTQADPKPDVSSLSAHNLAEPFVTSRSARERSNSRDGDTGDRLKTRGMRSHSRVWIWRFFLCVVALAVSYAFLRAVRLGTTNPEEIWKQAEADLENGDLGSVDKAIEILSRLRKPDPLDWFLRGQLAVARHHVDEAIDFLSRVPDGHRARPGCGCSPVRPS